MKGLSDLCLFECRSEEAGALLLPHMRPPAGCGFRAFYKERLMADIEICD